MASVGIEVDRKLLEAILVVFPLTQTDRKFCGPSGFGLLAGILAAIHHENIPYWNWYASLPD